MRRRVEVVVLAVVCVACKSQEPASSPPEPAPAPPPPPPDARPPEPLPDGATARFRPGPALAIHDVVFIDDGQLAAGAGDHVFVWQLDSKQLRHELAGHAGGAFALAVTGDGRLVTGGADKAVRVWDVTSGKELTHHAEHADVVVGVGVADKTLVISGSADRTFGVWRLDGDKPPDLLEIKGAVTGLAVSPVGIVAIAHGTSLDTRDLATGIGYGFHPPDREPVTALAVAPNGRLLAAGIGSGTIGLMTREGRKKGVLSGHEGSVNDLAFAPDSSVVVSTGDDGSARVWNVKDRSQRGELRGHDGAVRRVAVSPDGAWLATAGAGGDVLLWRMPEQP